MICAYTALAEAGLQSALGTTVPIYLHVEVRFSH